MRTVLVTGCGGPLGVNVTRSLKMAPEPLRVVGTDANRLHLPMSLADESVLIPPAKQLDAYLAALRDVVAARGVDMILPTHPVEVRAISAHRDRLPPVKLLLPDHEAILAADDKWRTNQLLGLAGIAVPRTYLIQKPEDLHAAFADLSSRPVWVRGSGAPGIGIGVASLPCRKVEHAIAWVDHHQGWGGFIASEYLPGGNLTWTGLYKDGALVASQSRERLEYVIPHVSPSGITGAPAVTRTLSRPALAAAGDAAVRVLMPAPNGVFFVDFKEDERGAACVTEINAGRFGTTIHFYTVAGCNFPYLAVRLAFGEAIPGAPLVDPIAPGTYWLRTLDCGPVLIHEADLPPNLDR